MSERHRTPADALNGAGVYAIRNMRTGASYVGASATVAAGLRAGGHLLGSARRHCTALRAAWNADGAEAFECTVLELVEHRSQVSAAVNFWRNTLCPLGLYNASHHGHFGRHASPRGRRIATASRAAVHVVTPAIHVNTATGVQRFITQEACRVVFQSRPLVHNVLHRVLAEAYLRDHPESHAVMQSILEEWEQHA